MSENRKIEGDHLPEQPPELLSLFLTAFGHKSKTEISQACGRNCAGKLGKLLTQAERDNTVLEIEADAPTDNEHHERAERIVCDGTTRFLGRCTAQVVSTVSGGIEFK